MALVAGGLYVMDPGSAPPGGGVPRAQAPPGLPYPEVPRVSVGEAKALLDANGAIFLDVRGPAEYGLGHIPGAVLMPLPDVERRAAEVPKASPVIAYCT
jgi:3-mercaptopyruvate sulfurtransferase SseA